MLLPTLWLHDYCDPGLDLKALEERLTMTGTKVERLFAHGVTALEYFMVGRVLSAEEALEYGLIDQVLTSRKNLPALVK